jgi:hypothetical protein
MLEANDIHEDQILDDEQIFGAQTDEDMVYPVEMAKLARICMNPIFH